MPKQEQKQEQDPSNTTRPQGDSRPLIQKISDELDAIVLLREEAELATNKLKDRYSLYTYLDQIVRQPLTEKTDLVALLNDILVTNQELLTNKKKRSALLATRSSEVRHWMPRADDDFVRTIRKIVNLCQNELEQLKEQDQDQETTASLDEALYKQWFVAEQMLSKIKHENPTETTTQEQQDQREALVTKLKERIAYCYNELEELRNKDSPEMSYKGLLSKRLEELNRIKSELKKQTKGSKKTAQEIRANENNIARMERFYQREILRIEKLEQSPSNPSISLKKLNEFIKKVESEAAQREWEEKRSSVDEVLTGNLQWRLQNEANAAGKKASTRAKGSSRSTNNGSSSGSRRKTNNKVGPRLPKGAVANGSRASSRRDAGPKANGQQASGKPKSATNGHGVAALGRSGAVGIEPLEDTTKTSSERPPLHTPTPTTKSRRQIWGNVGGVK